MLQAHYMRVGHVGILVYFVGVVGRDTAFGGEGKLGDDVDYLGFFTILRRLFSLLWDCVVQRLGGIARVLFAGRLRASPNILLFVRHWIDQFVFGAATRTRRDHTRTCLRLCRCVVIGVFGSFPPLTASWRALPRLRHLNFRCDFLGILSFVLVLLFDA